MSKHSEALFRFWISILWVCWSKGSESSNTSLEQASAALDALNSTPAPLHSRPGEHAAKLIPWRNGGARVTWGTMLDQTKDGGLALVPTALLFRGFGKKIQLYQKLYLN